MSARNSTGIHPTANSPRMVPPPNDGPADETLLLDLFEHADDIILAIDLTGRVLSANQALNTRLGYTLVEARQLSWEKLLPGYEMARTRRVFARHARGEERIRFELDAITASGDIASFEIDSRPVFRNGRLAGFHGIAHDIGDRKRMQQDLIRARREVARGKQAQSTLLADMNREIRAPIGDMLRFLSLAAKTPLSAQQRRYLETIESSAARLLNIFDDLYGRAQVTPERPADGGPGRGSFNGEDMTALVVDDNAVNRRFLCALLERYQMVTCQADCGTAAVIACRDRGYDVVMMDIQMADIDGIETTRRIRKLPGWRSCPIIAVSASETADRSQEILEAGMDEFLAKPIVERRLIELLAHYFPARATPSPNRR